MEFKIAQLRKLGYAVDRKVLNTLELGVPQNRERLLLVGAKKTIANRAVGKKYAAGEESRFPWPLIDVDMGQDTLLGIRRTFEIHVSGGSFFRFSYLVAIA